MKLKFFALPNHLGGYINCGWGNGYVVIPEGHKLHGMDYDSIHNDYDIDVNGGLTWSKKAGGLKDEPEWINHTDWIVGFDTAHSGDSRDKWPNEQAVLNETRKLAEQLEKL